MKLFSKLYSELDQTTRTSEKLAALRNYFQLAPPLDAAWAVYLFIGKKIGKTVSSTRIRQWAAEITGYPTWLMQECYTTVGDLSETLALLIPTTSDGENAPPLHEIIEQTIRPLGKSDEKSQRELIVAAWDRLNAEQRLVFHKLISGNFRVGVSRLTLVNALADLAGVETPVIEQRLAGNWKPDENTMTRLLAAHSLDEVKNSTLPHPFMLAHPLQKPPEEIGAIQEYLLEWKWDGIRAQIIRRENEIAIWSRGEELISPAFPEIVQAAASFRRGTVLDGEIVAWDVATQKPLPFQQLQPRINRISVQPSFWPERPITYIAFDLLEKEGGDLRNDPLRDRRELLREIIPQSQPDSIIRISQNLHCESWQQLQEMLPESRQRGVEGVMIKRLDSIYSPGRTTGLWWKLKIAPFTLDMVLIAAEPGHGKRAGLLTDYTFGVWHEGALLPMAKAYSGLTDEEIGEMDRFVRKHTTEKHGPVHLVEPMRVFEIAFEAIQNSTRHKSGLAVRFPRMLRFRQDKKPAEADTLETARALMNHDDVDKKSLRS